MSLAQFTANLFDFVLMLAMSACVIIVTYRVFIRANPDFDMQQEIKKGNAAVGVLVSSILLAASHILMAGTESSIAIFRMHMLAPSEENESLLKILALILTHLTFSMILAVISISVTLRLFGILAKELEAGKELQKGNMAVGLLLSAVVITSSIYVNAGAAALSKALRPQHSIGRVEIEK